MVDIFSINSHIAAKNSSLDIKEQELLLRGLRRTFVAAEAGGNSLRLLAPASFGGTLQTPLPQECH